jgi:glycosyltransferase involved in cell wall biosynthesis
MNRTKGQVDILVPTYNHENYINECIDSIFAQNYENFVIHVFDDFSQDKTFQKLLDLRDKWGDRLLIYRNEKRLGDGAKAIISHAPRLSGEYWAVIEGDDYWIAPDKLTNQITILNKERKAVGVASKTEMQDVQSGNNKIIEPDVSEWNYYDLLFKSNLNGHYVHISSIVWRNLNSKQTLPWPRSFLRDESPRGEVVLMHDILKNTGGSIILYPEVTSVYRYTGLGVWSQLTEAQQAEKNESITLYIRKTMPFWMRLLVQLRLERILLAKSLN